MRSHFPLRLLAVTLVSAVLVSPARAVEAVVHLPEDAPAGQSLGELHALLQLAPSERVELAEKGNQVFRIDASGRLVVAPRVRLDHESHPEYRLRVRIVDESAGSSASADPLQRRFRDLVGDQQKTRQDSDSSASSTARSATIRIVVDNVAEPPLLLGSRFRVEVDTTLPPGHRVGRAVAIDLDHDEQHQFELLEGDASIRIDPHTGELFLREDVHPQSVAMVRAVVRVTDRTGLSAQGTYPISLSSNPPAPPLPVFENEIRRAAETTPRVTSPALIDIPANPVSPPAIGSLSISANVPAATAPAPAVQRPALTEVTQGAVATTQNQSPAAQVAVTPPPPQHQPAEAGPTRQTAQLQSADATSDWSRLARNRFEWLTVCVAAMCVVVIVVSGVRDAVRAGQATVDSPPAGSAASNETPSVQAVDRDPREITDILERLDAFIGRSESPADSVETVSEAEAVSASEELTNLVDTRVAERATDVTAGEAPADSAAVATSVLSAPSRTVPAEQPSAAAVVAAPPRHETGRMTDEEQERMEHFREISRTMNRADIGRHHRERMRTEWMSVGVTGLACVVTGAVCVFTGCFGAMSIPMGSVLFSVAAVLLLRPSLYPQFPRQDVAPMSSGDQNGHQAGQD